MFAHITKAGIQPQIKTWESGCLQIHIYMWTGWPSFHFYLCSFSQYTQMRKVGLSPLYYRQFRAQFCTWMQVVRGTWGALGIPAAFWVLILEGAYLPGFKCHNCNPTSMTRALELAQESCIYTAKLISRSQNIERTLDTQGLHRIS